METDDPEPSGSNHSKQWKQQLKQLFNNEEIETFEEFWTQRQTEITQQKCSPPLSLNTRCLNTIPQEDQPEYPGNLEIEQRLKSLIRWNAIAMVVRANRAESGIGGHISTYTSSATLYEVGFNHFFKAPSSNNAGDQIYFQGHGFPY